MNDKDRVWKIGEEAALEYLRNKGYQIIEQNYRTKRSEIDLIVKKDKCLVFVEVRTKKGERFGSPEETIDAWKIRKLYWNAQAYSSAKKYQGASRIDAICIVLNQDNLVSRLNHYQNIENTK